MIAKSGMGDKLKILMGNYNKVFYDWGVKNELRRNGVMGIPITKEEYMEKSIEEYEAERADDRARIKELEAENERLSDLLWGARCVFCGEVIGKEKKNQDIADEVLRQHIKPMINAGERGEKLDFDCVRPEEEYKIKNLVLSRESQKKIRRKIEEWKKNAHK